MYCAYSEEKAKLLRQVGTAIQEKNDELETYLASMQLDALALDSSSEPLPQVCAMRGNFSVQFYLCLRVLIVMC